MPDEVPDLSGASSPISGYLKRGAGASRSAASTAVSALLGRAGRPDATQVPPEVPTRYTCSWEGELLVGPGDILGIAPDAQGNLVPTVNGVPATEILNES